MSKNKTQNDYEVGYGKPPKDNRFQKGISGNPSGHPKKSLDFDYELIRESNSLMSINENGQRKRISKHGVVIKQLMKLAMTGSLQAQRIYFDRQQKALDRAALMGGAQPNNSRKYDDVRNLTDEELMRIIAADIKKTKK
jgi:hypothetical protein